MKGKKLREYARKLPKLPGSELTYGPKWPSYRTLIDSGSHYQYSDVTGQWIFCRGPEEETY